VRYAEACTETGAPINPEQCGKTRFRQQAGSQSKKFIMTISIECHVRFTPMCGRLRVGKDFLERLQHWSVQPCVRPHMMVSPSSADWADRDPRRGSHHCRLSLQTSHPAGVDPNHCPAFGTGELQENGTTLCKRRRSAMPNNGDVPSDWRAAPHSQRRPDCGAD
jgi:hypothetical protein